MADGVDFYIDYGMMEEMSRLFQEAAKQIEETDSEMKQIATNLEGGALLGDAGEAFAFTIRVDLSKSLETIREKFEELVGDINGVIAIHRDGDTSAASRFK